MAENTDDKLIERIKQNLLKGYKEDSLRWALINQGYSRITVDRDIKRALKEIEDENKSAEQKKEKSEKPKITYQLYDENNRIVYGKTSGGKKFWKKLFGK